MKNFEKLFVFLSYLMYYLIKWHRGTPTVPPVGAVNVPTENPKIQKIHIFEDFWGHFFLINHIGFSSKYVFPKSSTDIFIEKIELFSNFFIFHFVSIFHPQSLKVSLRNSLCTARQTKITFFSARIREIPMISPTNFLPMLLNEYSRVPFLQTFLTRI